MVGAGPAGLMAAEVLAQGGARVAVFERMPNPARKFLMAGRGGLNLTHSEPPALFLSRYGAAAERLAPHLAAFGPAEVVAWCEALGQETFVGSSGRVFPRAMKASPLLRAWLARLGGLGVALHPRHRWAGWAGGALRFETPEGERQVAPAATILALGGASWPRLGADGAWAAWVPGVVPFAPSNMGFRVAWSPLFANRFAGAPLKRVRLSFAGFSLLGEALVTRQGLEGGLLYAASARLRDAIAARGPVTVLLDLRPDLALPALRARLGGPGISTANRLRRAGLSPAAAGLVREALAGEPPRDDLAALVKSVPLLLEAPMGLDRAISSAGGLRWEGGSLMLEGRAGTFCAGEMLDWEAPTGGHLLTACLATGRAAAKATLDWLGARASF